MEAPDDDTGDDRDDEARDDIDKGNLPAEHGEQHGGGYLVDEGGCDQE